MYDNIFKSYDIRGIVGEELTSEFAYDLGRALVVFLNVKKIAVGSDMRVSSPELKESMLKGIIDQGADAIDLGQVSTDTTYFVSGKYNLATVMITASHNPGKYNGFKICKPGAIALSYEEGLKPIKKLLQKGDLPSSEEKGSLSQENYLEEYITTLVDLIGKESIQKLKVVVDAGNGMAGVLIPVLEKLVPQLEIIPLYFELDGNFPNHPANPIEPENLRDIIAKVNETSADIGLAFDGDADRVYLIDNNGEAVSAALTGAMVAKAMLQEKKGTVTYNVNVGWIVPETIEKFGGKALITPAGHSLIKPLMREHDALFGIEHSGHYYFNDLYYADSGLLTALYVLQLLSKEERVLSDVLEEFKVYASLNETNFKVSDAKIVMDTLYNQYHELGNASRMDGVRIDFDDWWFCVRPSNTEPLLRLNMGAKTKEILDEKKNELISFIKS